ncbi:MAG: hypothetical protein CMJ78_27580 [Planctomycetaceae bacterium]|nr:hypothetical protein [Planctomycetaceae bacterium]
MATQHQKRVTRRDVLKVGTLGMGLSLPGLLAAETAGRRSGLKPRADHCIVIFLNGGPPHHDMWDMKPEASDGIRGEFKPIASSIPGYQVGELLPRLAQHMHRSTVVRSMHHSVNNAHAAAVYASLTGHDRGELGGGAKPDDNPTPGAVISMQRPPDRSIVPQVHLPYKTQEGRGGPPQPGFFGGFLGQSKDPLFVLRDPNADNFKIPELTRQDDVTSSRLTARRELFGVLNSGLNEGNGVSYAGEMSGFQQRALDLLTSEATQNAFRLDQESAKVRDSYGRNIYGQSTLLARRLIEAGTRTVTISWAPDANATWDTHTGNFSKLRSTLLPQFDAASSSLIQDLAERGMIDRTLIAILGDFGRTPKINAKAGRDHWNFCYSLMMVGGGFHQGLIYGTSDNIGAYPDSNPLIPGDIISTLYHCMGIRHDSEIYDKLERPHRLVPTGDVVNELLV